jgi:hypothetical protein
MVASKSDTYLFRLDERFEIFVIFSVLNISVYELCNNFFLVPDI